MIKKFNNFLSQIEDSFSNVYVHDEYYQEDNRKIIKLLKTRPLSQSTYLLSKYFKTQKYNAYFNNNEIDVLFGDLKDSTDRQVYFKNPFTDLHLSIHFKKYSAGYYRSPLLYIYNKYILNRNYFESYKVLMDLNFIEYYSNISNNDVKIDKLIFFEFLLYHELAHASFTQIVNLNSNKNEKNSDLSALIRVIKNNNLNQDKIKKVIDNHLLFRLHGSPLYSYTLKTKQNKVKLRDHSVENCLLYLRYLNNSEIKFIHNVSDRHITQFAYFLVDEIDEHSKNLFSNDDIKKENLKATIMKNLSPNLFTEDQSYLFYNMFRFTTIKKGNELTTYERDDIIYNLTNNSSINIDIFNDVMIINLLLTNFDYYKDNIVKKESFSPVFKRAAIRFYDYLLEYNKSEPINNDYNFSQLNNYLKKNL